MSADHRKHQGFTARMQLSGSIERVSVTLDAEAIERMWAAGPTTTWHPKTIEDLGTVGRFTVSSDAEGAVWASYRGVFVLVVKAEAAP